MWLLPICKIRRKQKNVSPSFLDDKLIKEFAMAKKQKRSVSASTTAPTKGESRSTEFSPDYTYIKKDLKKIGIMAASFFVILIAVSFFLA